MDFAEFTVEFTDEPGVVRKVWLFSMILGHSRWLWGRFVASQNLQSVLRRHVGAFEAIGGAPEEILCDRMKTAVIGEDDAGIVTYNASLVALLSHYSAVPRACRPYRAKTKGKIERRPGQRRPRHRRRRGQFRQSRHQRLQRCRTRRPAQQRFGEPHLRPGLRLRHRIPAGRRPIQHLRRADHRNRRRPESRRRRIAERHGHL